MIQSPLLSLVAGKSLVLTWDFSPQTFPGILYGSEPLTLMSGLAVLTACWGGVGVGNLDLAMEGVPPSPLPHFPLAVVVIQITTQLYCVQ